MLWIGELSTVSIWKKKIRSCHFLICYAIHSSWHGECNFGIFQTLAIKIFFHESLESISFQTNHLSKWDQINFAFAFKYPGFYYLIFHWMTFRRIENISKKIGETQKFKCNFKMDRPHCFRQSIPTSSLKENLSAYLKKRRMNDEYKGENHIGYVTFYS